MENLILSIDPGSVRSGWCIMTHEKELVDGGVLLPNSLRASNDIRIAQMCEDLRELLGKWMPGVILIEWPSGHVGRKRHRGAGAYLSIYGAALGSLWREIIHWKKSLPAEQFETEVVLIDETRWTGGVDKFSRAKVIDNLFPRYNIKKDAGLDLADSIGICLWYLKNQAIRSGHFA